MAGEEHPVRLHEETFKEIKSLLKDHEEKLFKGAQKISVTVDSIGKLERRMDAREEELKIITRLAISVEGVTGQIEKILEQMELHTKRMDGHDTKITTLERAPGDTAIKYWQVAVACAITFIVGSTLTYMVGALLQLPKP
jgi:chromosome segregation ATPase